MKWLSVVAAVVLVVLVMHPGGGSTLDISPLVSCTPDCTGVADMGTVPDPLNCTNYYLCMSGLPAYPPISCDTGNVYSPETGSCESGYECVPLCGPGGGGCPLSCNGSLSIIADYTDCNVYYICGPGDPVPAACPADRPHFNGVDCVNDESVCCSGYCEPYCDGSGTDYLIPDPLDCTRFYLCDADTPAGPPDEGKHLFCADGMIFNVATPACVPGDASTCVTLCDAATGGGGGSSTTPGSGGGSSTTPGSGGGSSSTPGPVTTTGGSSGCEEEPYTCPGEGRYPVCHYCFPLYYECTGYGAEGEVKQCTGTSVFHPTDRFCMSEETCNETTP